MNIILKIKILFLVFFLSTTSAFAEQKFYKDWTTTEVIQEVIWQGLHIIDWGQTLNIADNPDEYYETNNLLKEHPTRSQVNVFMLITAVGHFGISWVMPNNITFDIFGCELNPRTIFQTLTIISTAYTVGNNYNIGLRMAF